MELSRLDFIEERIKRNLSAPDLPELALELAAALRKHLHPASVKPPPEPFVFNTHPIPEPALVEKKVPPAVIIPDEPKPVPPVLDTPDVTPPETPKSKGRK